MQSSISSRSSCIRPVDPTRDLYPIADLIETCFGHQMDEEGLNYVKHIRMAASDSAYRYQLQGSNEFCTYPLHGYVWEADNHIVGNLTLLPYKRQDQWIYMIVNVAVHPDYRRKGIARNLTLRGLDHIRDHKVNSAWLQVRVDNPQALGLYHSIGFVEKTRRSTWVSGPIPDKPSIPEQVIINSRRTSDWELQSSWLQAAYPQEVAWNLPFILERFQPGFWNNLQRFLIGDRIQQWSARLEGNLVGTASREPTRQFADTLWLAVSPQNADLAIRVLLPHIQRERLYSTRKMLINYPTGFNDEAFKNAGYTLQNILIWMEKLI